MHDGNVLTLITVHVNLRPWHPFGSLGTEYGPCGTIGTYRDPSRYWFRYVRPIDVGKYVIMLRGYVLKDRQKLQ